ncbi:MAG: ABC transporter ATP-binding protein/permease [Cyclobacteriaceae bacterium]|nr:ABC transporter ATP-binding protein/permease [Cyclobacteriaceae bacterium]
MGKKGKVSLSQVFKTIILPRWKLLLLGLFFVIINRLAGLVLPGSSKYLMDNVIGEGDLEMLKVIIIAVIAALLIQSVTSFLLTLILSVEAQHLIARLRVKVHQQVLKLPVRFFDNNKSGTLVSRVMNDVEGVRNLVGTGLVQLFGGTLTAIVATTMMIKISPKLTLMVLVPVLVFGLISMKAFNYIRPIFRKRRVIHADVNGRLTESLSGIRVIKGFNAQDQEIKIFEDGVEKLFRNIKKSMVSTSLVTSSATFLLGLASAGIMGFGGYMIVEGSITTGDFLSFTLFLGFMVAPIIQMSNIGTQITEALAGLDRTEEIMNESTEADRGKHNVVLQHIKGDMEFRDVNFGYDQETMVLEGIKFDAPAGSVTALVGSSGSGKSTIAGLAASFLQPTSGEVLLDGQDMSSISLESFRQHLGVVLQDEFLFEGTIRENILFPRPTATDDQLMEAVKAAHVNEFTDRFEDGMDTVIGERGVKLSGGQRQRIAIARAILADPRILILDEATSNLDTESESFIQESLGELMKGRTTIVIAHRLSTIRKADQILVIEGGRIVERGTHDELIASEGRYYQLFTYQSRI